MLKCNPLTLTNHSKLLLISVITNILLLGVWNEKSYILVVLFFGIFIFLFSKASLVQTLLLCTILCLPFAHGIRSWMISDFYFGISLKLIFSVSTILLLLATHKENFRIKPSALVFFWLWILLAAVSAIAAPLTNLAGWSFIQMAIPFIIFICSSMLCHQDREFAISCLLVVCATLFIQSLVGSYQTLSQSLLKIFLEETSGGFAFATTDGERIFRASGLLGHPTFFGSLLSMLIPIIISIQSTISPSPKLQNLFFKITQILAIIATIGTFSRSAWLSLCVCIALFIMWRKNDIRYYFHTTKTIIPSLAIIFLVFAPLIISRINSFATFFSLGNGPGRMALVEYAKKMIIDFPITGVGPGHFTTAMKTYGLNEMTQGFVFPVHNTVLLMMSELGIPAATAFCLGVYSILKRTYPKHPTQDFLKTGLWLAIIAFILNSQVHPLLYQDPTLGYVALFLGILDTV